MSPAEPSPPDDDLADRLRRFAQELREDHDTEALSDALDRIVSEWERRDDDH